MKKVIITLVLVLLSSNLAFAEFSDISNYKEDTFSQFITWLEDQGVVQGYDDGTFKPGNNVNRAEFLKMLYETIGMQGLETELPFPDVPADQWYTKYVKEAYASGVVQGYPDGNFRPGDYINFAEATKIVMDGFFDVDNLYDDEYVQCAVDLSTYPSVDTKSWYWKYIHVADELCILQRDISPKIWEFRGGDPVPYLIDFDPGTYITRADMAALLYIAKAVKDNGNQKYTSFSMYPKDVLGSVDIPALGTDNLTFEVIVHNDLVYNMNVILDVEEAFYLAYIDLNEGDDIATLRSAFDNFKAEIDVLDEFFKDTKFASSQLVFVDEYNENYKPFVDDYLSYAGEFVTTLETDGVTFDVMDPYFSTLDTYTLDFIGVHNRFIDIVNLQVD